jgi:hypothetical protein
VRVAIWVVAVVVAGSWALSAGWKIYADAYPGHWAGIPFWRTCQSVAGTYAQRGERVGNYPGGGFLGLTHLATFTEVIFGGERVTLAFPDRHRITMTAGVARDFPIAGTRADCHRGWLRLRRSFRAQTYFGPEWTWETILLARARDGWLVARWEHRRLLLFLYVVPAYGEVVEWYRYAPVEVPASGE